MKRYFAAFAVVMALVAVEAAPVSASTPIAGGIPVAAPLPSAKPGIKPALEKKAAPGRSVEWAEYDWHLKAISGGCTGPYGSGKHEETQWACYGIFPGVENVEWQVNLDAYGNQTYHVSYEN